MDLRAQISQLDEIIINLTESIERQKEELTEANRKRKAYYKLLTAAEALEEQKPEKKTDK